MIFHFDIKTVCLKGVGGGILFGGRFDQNRFTNPATDSLLSRRYNIFHNILERPYLSERIRLTILSKHIEERKNHEADSVEEKRRREITSVR